VAHPTKSLGPGPPGLPCSAPWVLGDAVSFPSGVRGGAPTTVAFCCIKCYFKTHFGSLVSIAMSGSGRIWYLLASCNLRHINIIRSRSNWQVNFCKVRNCGPLNFAALFGRTPLTCLRLALRCWVVNFSTRALKCVQKPRDWGGANYSK